MTSDSFDNLVIPGSDWSSYVVASPSSSEASSVLVQQIALFSAVLSGVVSQVGDTLQVTINDPQLSQPTTFNVTAVGAVDGGVLAQDDYGGLYLFASSPLVQGDSYGIVAGFGSFYAPLEPISCFAAGTLILTERGYLPVQSLTPAMCVLTNDGEHAPVVAVGRRRVNCDFHTRPQAAWPVWIAKDAIGRRLPCEDLLLSPEHCVFIHGALIPSRLLVNGSTIRQIRIPEITYFHVRLARHSVIFAHNLPTESFRAGGARFDEWVGVSGDGDPDWYAEQKPTARLVVGGKALRRVRRKLHARSRSRGYYTTDEANVRVAADGRCVPVSAGRNSATAVIPPGVSHLELLSRFARPVEISEDLTDTRQLGIAVTQIVLGATILPVASLNAKGWHRWEGAFRWTNGNASISIPPSCYSRSLEVAFFGLPEYWCGTHATRVDRSDGL